MSKLRFGREIIQIIQLKAVVFGILHNNNIYNQSSDFNLQKCHWQFSEIFLNIATAPTIQQKVKEGGSTIKPEDP